MELQGKKVLVVGAAKSGLAVTRFLLGKGARAVLTDSKKLPISGELAELAAEGAVMRLGEYPAVRPGDFDLLVVSPGVPLTVDPVREGYENGVPVLGELELAWRFISSPVVAVTGTNGKTTTTTLIGEILRKAGYNTLVAGNIGLPLVTGVEQYGPDDYIVAEVSSFQLETTSLFRPKVGLILNITPDHLDRHGNMENYIKAKARIFMNQGPGDFTVLNYDDGNTRRLAGDVPGGVLFFSRRRELEKGAYVRGGQIVYNLGSGVVEVCPAARLAIPGAHNLENALAATAAAAAAGVGADVLAETLTSFQGVSHRLEFVAEINGVRYINDSKGTNPDASIKALEAYDAPIVLIAGGKNKGSDFSEFAAKVKEKVRAMVVLGQCAADIAAAARAKGFTEILSAGGFQEAVLLAHRAARPGEIVLLSPACASWDMFNSYEERGDLFKEIVRELAGRLMKNNGINN
ncbi:MAG: UDP-N-acetylmuramoyl-L-alanine--D-glutamate ligase [Firmicutes bacterium]|nr:UDP-N-acetylmuramoyl-L-alanine--D-glutamate ligase [Bacillota bacterium]